jgi:hypothetical protein
MALPAACARSGSTANVASEHDDSMSDEVHDASTDPTGGSGGTSESGDSPFGGPSTGAAGSREPSDGGVTLLERERKIAVVGDVGCVLTAASEYVCSPSTSIAPSAFAEGALQRMVAFDDYGTRTGAQSPALLCGTRDSGGVDCWGPGTFDSELQVASPNVPELPSQGRLIDLAVGHAVAGVLDDAGNVSAWSYAGGNVEQQTGSWRQIAAQGIAAGATRFCGIDGGGAIDCWSWSPQFQLTELGAPSGTFVQLALDSIDAACALDHMREIVCWDTANRPAYEQLPEGPFKQLAAGYFGLCAIRADDTLLCWDDLDERQLEVANGSLVREVEIGAFTACARRMDDTAFCWQASGRTFEIEGP